MAPKDGKSRNFMQGVRKLLKPSNAKSLENDDSKIKSDVPEGIKTALLSEPISTRDVVHHVSEALECLSDSPKKSGFFRKLSTRYSKKKNKKRKMELTDMSVTCPPSALASVLGTPSGSMLDIMPVTAPGSVADISRLGDSCHNGHDSLLNVNTFYSNNFEEINDEINVSTNYDNRVNFTEIQLENLSNETEPFNFLPTNSSAAIHMKDNTSMITDTAVGLPSCSSALNKTGKENHSAKTNVNYIFNSSLPFNPDDAILSNIGESFTHFPVNTSRHKTLARNTESGGRPLTKLPPIIEIDAGDILNKSFPETHEHTVKRNSSLTNYTRATNTLTSRTRIITSPSLIGRRCKDGQHLNNIVSKIETQENDISFGLVASFETPSSVLDAKEDGDIIMRQGVKDHAHCTEKSQSLPTARMAGGRRTRLNRLPTQIRTNPYARCSTPTIPAVPTKVDAVVYTGLIAGDAHADVSSEFQTSVGCGATVQIYEPDVIVNSCITGIQDTIGSIINLKDEIDYLNLKSEIISSTSEVAAFSEPQDFYLPVNTNSVTEETEIPELANTNGDNMRFVNIFTENLLEVNSQITEAVNIIDNCAYRIQSLSDSKTCCVTCTSFSCDITAHQVDIEPTNLSPTNICSGRSLSNEHTNITYVLPPNTELSILDPNSLPVTIDPVINQGSTTESNNVTASIMSVANAAVVSDNNALELGIGLTCAGDGVCGEGHVASLPGQQRTCSAVPVDTCTASPSISRSLTLPSRNSSNVASQSPRLHTESLEEVESYSFNPASPQPLSENILQVENDNIVRKDEFTESSVGWSSSPVSSLNNVTSDVICSTNKVVYFCNNDSNKINSKSASNFKFKSRLKKPSIVSSNFQRQTELSNRALPVIENNFSKSNLPRLKFGTATQLTCTKVIHATGRSIPNKSLSSDRGNNLNKLKLDVSFSSEPKSTSQLSNLNSISTIAENITHSSEDNNMDDCKPTTKKAAESSCTNIKIGQQKFCLPKESVWKSNDGNMNSRNATENFNLRENEAEINPGNVGVCILPELSDRNASPISDASVDSACDLGTGEASPFNSSFSNCVENSVPDESDSDSDTSFQNQFNQLEEQIRIVAKEMEKFDNFFDCNDEELDEPDDCNDEELDDPDDLLDIMDTSISLLPDWERERSLVIQNIETDNMKDSNIDASANSLKVEEIVALLPDELNQSDDETPVCPSKLNCGIESTLMR